MPRTMVFHGISMVVYGLALVAFLVAAARAGRRAAVLGLAVAAVGAALNVAAIVQRGRDVGHVPFQAIYEVCLLIAVAPVISYGMVYLLMRFRSAEGARARVAAGLGALAMALSLGSMGGAVWAGDRHLKLPPALQSAYFVPHVLIYAMAYGILGLAALAGLLYLVLHYASWRRAGLGPGRGAAAGLVDELGYTFVTVGFAFLTGGMILGCLWAQQAWGDWWSWDVKETWALISWLIYAVYLHLRLTRRWRGARSAWLAFAGAAAVLVCFLLLDFLPGSSPHKYT